jgi:hypothetical protein
MILATLRISRHQGDHLLLFLPGGREAEREGGRVGKGASASQPRSAYQPRSTFSTWALRSHCLVHLDFIQKEPLDDLPDRHLPAIWQRYSASIHMHTPRPPHAHTTPPSLGQSPGAELLQKLLKTVFGNSLRLHWFGVYSRITKRLTVHSGVHRDPPHLVAVRKQKYAYFYLAAQPHVPWR